VSLDWHELQDGRPYESVEPDADLRPRRDVEGIADNRLKVPLAGMEDHSPVGRLILEAVDAIGGALRAEHPVIEGRDARPDLEIEAAGRAGVDGDDCPLGERRRLVVERE